MTTQTIQGASIGKFSFKKLFKKVGAAFKKVGQVVKGGLAKANPALIVARAAVLKLVSGNAYGLADKFAAKGIDKARKMWEGLGGDFGHLQKAVEKGRGQRISGIRDLESITGDDDFAALMASVHGETVEGIGTLAALWKTALSVAKPILDKLLSLMGVNLGEDGEKMAEDVQTATAPADDFGLQNLQAMQTVMANANDALDPNTGSGTGSNSGMSTGVKVAIGAGVALALYAIFGAQRSRN